MKKQFLGLALSAIVTIGLFGLASAQQVTGVLGSASATTTISGKQLPPPDPKFGGVIKQRASESTPWWPPRVVPPKKAPNVLLIMTDDDGFGSPSTFGGVIPTPALDRIAKSGLRYTNFHSTSLCSPTRAALISPGATTTRWASAWWARSQPASLAMTRSSRSRRARSARS